jgi:hypothetical protein
MFDEIIHSYSRAQEWHGWETATQRGGYKKQEENVKKT